MVAPVTESEMLWIGTTAAGITFLRFVLAGAFTNSLSTFPCALSLFTKSFEPIVRMKLHENVFYFLWHTLSSCWNLSLLVKEAWFTNFQVDELHRNASSHFMSPDVRLFYLTSLAFWLSCSVYLGFECRRKDFRQMVAHHGFTVGLIAGSLVLNYFRFGLVVLIIHDLVDVFLYLVKTFVYISKKFPSTKLLTDLIFVVFALAFFSLRIVAFPTFVIFPAVKHLMLFYLRTGDLRETVKLGAFPAALSGLYCLHVFWFRLIVKIAIRNLRDKKLDDSRSDSDSAAEAQKTLQKAKSQ